MLNSIQVRKRMAGRRAKELPENISPTLSTRITAELRNRDMTVMDFRRELEGEYGKKVKIPGYNHILRVCKGETFPGPNLLPRLCKFLGFDPDEAMLWVKMDKAIKNGGAQAFTGRDTQLLKFENLWKTLSQNSKDELFMLAQLKSKLDQSA